MVEEARVVCKLLRPHYPAVHTPLLLVVAVAVEIAGMVVRASLVVVPHLMALLLLAVAVAVRALLVRAVEVAAQVAVVVAQVRRGKVIPAVVLFTARLGFHWVAAVVKVRLALTVLAVAHKQVAQVAQEQMMA